MGPAPRNEGGPRRFFFLFGMGWLFATVGVLSELLFYLLHVNTYVLYLVGVPSLIGLVITGAIPRVYRNRLAWYWTGFVVCMFISVPFSSWVGGSTGAALDYIRFNLPMMFVVGGLAVGWKDVRTVFRTIAAAGVLNVITARLFAREDNGRIDLQASGTIGNSNDLSSHLMFVLPFILFVAMDRKVPRLIRLALIPVIGYGVATILGTASRGALIALVCCFLMVLFTATVKQRVAALAILAGLAVLAPLFLNAEAVARLASLSGGQHAEAEESKESREYLLRQSIIFTLQHPVFGIGLAQFANFEGLEAKAKGEIGNWHETHNSYTQVSSECGLPAAVLFALGIAGTIGLANRVYREARRRGFAELASAGFCFQLSLVGYAVTIMFLSNAYRFYLPAAIGLAIAFSAAAKEEMAASRPAR